MSALSPAAIEAIDRGGMLGDVLAQPDQLADAIWRVESTGIEPEELAGGLCVCGMGGSAIGAELARGALGERARHPVRALRGYSLEPWAGAQTLVLCASYSGDTEETLACFEAAAEAGARLAALTTGGELAARARARGVPVIGIPGGMQPRAAVIYMTVATLQCATLCGAAPDLRGEIEGAQALLESLAREWGPDAAEGSRAKALARRLQGTISVIHGAGATDALATRWKTQINENAKLPAFRSTLPEADHNEICAWEAGAHLAPLSAIFLDDPALDPRLRRRIEVTAGELAAVASVERVEAVGDTQLERTLSLLLLGDLVSVYLAVLAGVDPMPVEAIERLKSALAGSS